MKLVGCVIDKSLRNFGSRDSKFCVFTLGFSILVNVQNEAKAEKLGGKHNVKEKDQKRSKNISCVWINRSSI